MEGKVKRSSGPRDSGRSICKESRITSVLCIRWILRWAEKMDCMMCSCSENEAWAIFWDVCTISWHPIQTRCRILIRICRTSFKSRYRFIRYRKNGFGAKAGVAWKRRRRRKRLICVTIRCTRNPSWIWLRESFPAHCLTRVGLV